MQRLFSRRLSVGALTVALMIVLGSASSRVSRGQELAAVEQLKTEAFKALRGGDFDRTSELLVKAASLSPQDSNLSQMVRWTAQFESLRHDMVTERRKQYEKAVSEVHLLIKNHKEGYAIDTAARAYLLADDKKTFRNETWVDDLIRVSEKKATEYDAAEQWLKSLRVYSDLSSLEPANPEWKDKLKLATRRIRLLALYTPEQMKAIQESEMKEREEAEALLKPATQPATKHALDPTTENSGFNIDWHETLRGIKMEMLRDALEDAKKNYYRDVTYRDLMTGGLTGLQAVATTKGLEKAFPSLGDPVKRGNFLRAMDDNLAAAKNTTASSEQMMLSGLFAKLKTINDESIQLPEEVLVSEFADGAFAMLDPFSSMIWPTDVPEFNKSTQGKFSGVGIQIQSDDDGSLRVVSPLEDSPAYAAKIKAGDIIARIDGKDAKGISLNQAVKSITGPKGTSVTLTIRSPDGASRDVKIVRDFIQVASIKGWLHKPGGGWDYFVDPAQKIGYLRLTNFTQTTSDELDKAVDDMKEVGARGLILDLRYNPGGLLTAAKDVSDKFLKEGLIVSVRADRETPNMPNSYTAEQKNDDVGLPLIVLVNQYSASASEIVSGALKDQKRAMIVGERTFGKGSVQMLFALNQARSAFLKLTTSHYYLPSGRCIHREENSQEWGVDPDLTIEMTPEQMRAAIDSRQEMDILRDSNTPAKGKEEKLQEDAPKVEGAVANVKKDPLTSDPQLSAALLVLRLQLSGAQL